MFDLDDFLIDGNSNQEQLTLTTQNLTLNNNFAPHTTTNIETSNLNHSTSYTTNNKKTTTKRIKRYCPVNAKLNLECEWSDCNQTFTDMDSFLRHVDQHLDLYDSSSSNEDQHQNQKFQCEWTACDADEFHCDATFKRHVKFHAFHTKLKQHGAIVLKNLEDAKKSASLLPTSTTSSTEEEQQQLAINLPKCNLDDETRNYIPELPFKFECAWNQCAYTTDSPELFYRHIKQEHVDTVSSKLKDSKCLWGECEQILSNKNRFAEHIRHHSQEKLIACPTCGALFATAQKFVDHCSRSSDLGSIYTIIHFY
jgi:uncharacterized C2H2 Zn-finger protein